MTSADAYLPVWVYNIPIEFVMCGRILRPQVASYVKQGVVKVIAGPTHCHIRIDVKRPYYRQERRVAVEAGQ